MPFKRALHIIAAAIGTAAVGATLLSGCAGSNWTPKDLSKPGAVESIACDELNAARDAKSIAVNTHDEKAQKTLGLLNAQGVLDQELVRDIERRFGERAKSPECTGANKAVVTTTAPNPASCGGFVVKLDPNKDGNLISGGLSDEPVKARQEVLDKAKQDPRILLVYFNASPLATREVVKSEAEIAPLKDGQCYTDNGKRLYNDWAKVWTGAMITATEIPAVTGINTGATPGGAAFQQEGILPGGKGYRIQYPGQEHANHDVAEACANPTRRHGGKFPGIGEKPPGAPNIVTTTKPPVTTTNPPTTAPPITTPPSSDKNPDVIPGQQGAQGDGGASQYGGVGQDPPRTAAPQAEPPSAGPEPPAYVPPAPEPAPAPPPVQTTRDPNPPTVAPPAQPPNHGTVPTTGCDNPDFC